MKDAEIVVVLILRGKQKKRERFCFSAMVRIEFGERVFFTVDFPSGLVFVSFELVGAFMPGGLFGAAHE